MNDAPFAPWHFDPAADDDPEPTTHEDLSPVWDAVCAKHPRIIEHITGSTDHGLGLAQCVRAFHAEAVALHLPLRPDLLAAMLGRWPEGAFGHRAGTETFAKDVGDELQKCVDEQRAKKRDEANPFFVPQGHDLQAVPLVMHRASDWATRPAPQMRWMVEDWIPRQQVTGIYGVGGVRKTTLLQQGLMAESAGLVFLGRKLAARPSLGMFCEDTAEELVRRQVAIAAFYGRPMSDFGDFHWVSLVGHENTELVTFDGQRIAKADLLLWLDYYIGKHGIGAVGLDTIAHFFGGDEVRRHDVARFIRTLDGISITRDCAFVFNAHPSARGKSSGTMESGSTHWEAGVRSRLAFIDPTTPEGDEITDADPNAVRRVLKRLKSNYAPAGETIELIYRDGGFTPAAVDAEAAKLRQRGPGRDAACEERFLELLAKIGEQGRHVHEANSAPAYYAPAVFARHPGGKLFTLRDFEAAMRRLLNDKKLRIEQFGPPSRGWRKLVRVQP